MGAKENAALAAREAAAIIEGVEAAELEALAAAIGGAKRIFVAGAGRSLLMMRAFAMRLMHLGHTAFVADDTTTPAIGEGDLLIVGSASGGTATLLVKAEKAKAAGARLAALTIHRGSPLGTLAACVVVVPGATDKTEGGFRSAQPAGSSFEQALLLVLELAARQGLPPGGGFTRHANLE